MEYFVSLYHVRVSIRGYGVSVFFVTVCLSTSAWISLWEFLFFGVFVH